MAIGGNRLNSLVRPTFQKSPIRSIPWISQYQTLKIQPICELRRGFHFSYKQGLRYYCCVWLQTLSSGDTTMKRKGDPKTQPRYRSDRIVEEGGKWFFYTREGTMKGPFEGEMEARLQVEVYLKVLASNMLSADSELSMELLKQAG